MSKSVANIPVPFDNFIVQDFMVTNAGQVSILGKTIQRQRRRVLNSTVGLYRLSDSTFQQYLLPDSVEIKHSKLVYDRMQDRVKVVGFYGDKEHYGIEGTVFYSLDSNDKPITLFNKFSEDFIKKATVNDRNNGAMSEGFSLISIVPRSDGGVLLVAEQKEIATEDDIIMVNGIPQSTSKNIYNFNEILVMNYDQNGFMDWFEVITKNQTTINDGGYFSSAVVYVGDKFIQLFYNDQLRSSGDVVQYTIYNNGKSESANLLKADLDYVAIIPVESKQVSSNKVIIPTSKNRRFALLKIIYD